MLLSGKILTLEGVVLYLQLRKQGGYILGCYGDGFFSRRAEGETGSRGWERENICKERQIAKRKRAAANS